MKNNKLKIAFGFVICVIMLVGTVLPIFGAAYSTYTYSIDGTQLSSPDAYTPQKVFDSKSMGVEQATGYALDELQDLVVDKDGYIYIVDITGNLYDPETDKIEAQTNKISRVIVLDRYFKFAYEIRTFINGMGAEDKLNNAAGMCVTDKNIYIADTLNKRIVVLKRENTLRNTMDPEATLTQQDFVTIINEPEGDVITSTDIYRPVAVASDDTHVYVVSSSTINGVISMNINGEFKGYIGAQKVTKGAWEIFISSFLTAEQKAKRTQYVSTEYNNIVIDANGFIYVTTSSLNQSEQAKAITSRSTSSNYAPVKKLNTNGDDIMSRTGFYPPSGEVNMGRNGVSTIVDVAIGPAETWSIIDMKRQRVFTYDKNGNLLFAFGDRGDQLGNIKNLKAVAYQEDNMLLMDAENVAITSYTRTEYGDLLITALENDNNRLYDRAVYDYDKILQRNINFDTAYIGIAKSLYRSGDYEGAMEEYSFAYNTSGYSQAFKMYRKDWVSKYILIVPVIIVVVVIALTYFFKYAGKVNAKTAITTGKRTFGQEILFAFHLMLHPFDGYWDLKHEKRGSVRGAAFYIMIAVLVFTYQSVGRSYMYNPRGTYSSIGVQFLSIVVPIALWVVANWCLTTLFDGEGSVKDIFIATGYALAPMPLLIIPATLLTHILASSESGIINLLISFAWVWVGLLIFFGVMVTHDYSILKNIITSIGTIVGMAFIMFLVILFATLVSDMIGLVSNIITEITYRM